MAYLLNYSTNTEKEQQQQQLSNSQDYDYYVARGQRLKLIDHLIRSIFGTKKFNL